MRSVFNKIVVVAGSRSVGKLFVVTMALFICSCVTTLDPDSLKGAEVHNKLAYSYMNNGQLNEAYVELQKALKLNPGNKETLKELGYISSRFGNRQEAILYYKKAIAVDPDYSEALNNLGVTYAELGEWDNAIDSFKSALRNPVYSTPEWAYANMGYAYYKKEDYLNAEAVLKEALIRNAVLPRGLYILGLVSIELDKNEEAIEHLLNAVGIMPDYLDAHWELANSYLRAGETAKALKHFNVITENEEDTARSTEAREYIDLFK